MVGLEARRERAFRAEPGASLGGAGDAPGDEDELVDVAQLAEGRGHHAGERRADAPDLAALGAEQAILQLAQREIGDGREARMIDGVVDPHHLVDLPSSVVRAIVEVLERERGQDRSSRLALALVRGREARVPLTGLAVVGGAEQALEPEERDLLAEGVNRVELVRPWGGHPDSGQGLELLHFASSPSFPIP